MHIKTILNRIEKHRSFVYGAVTWRTTEDGEPVLEVGVRSRRNSRPACSGCGRKGTTYDHLSPRRFEFVPLWGIVVYFLYAMRRVDCPRCGVTVERVPWALGKRPVTTTYAWFLARWAK
ncbi:MAG: ISL3 family transposase, partial [Planctomycetes bacterium]|nr:ISL3 family transposase [Planctomycetota bacterium]